MELLELPPNDNFDEVRRFIKIACQQDADFDSKVQMALKQATFDIFGTKKLDESDHSYETIQEISESQKSGDIYLKEMQEYSFDAKLWSISDELEKQIKSMDDIQKEN